MNRSCFLAGAVALATGLALLAGCAPPDGPPGVVVDKTNPWSPATKTRRYFLTVATADGRRTQFRVSLGDYRHCVRGAHYPHCTKG
ncbi:hypothetical protein OG783_17670 [Streptomyces jietaisiensis]|uniref:hypothetical protein n=1 Tax=Streptomyces griseoaurantiacus TaxID=68213 RepID=UPI00324E0DD7